ncbi:hypothetical protein J2S43_005522 [Catenuloplanes nepalensis]|uniref:Uncharacterized protein n=1 Tax=Catenuloplanes nepalensis TaxID=587533 RepID=A0ABT9N075_9ACTN|nr:hypothetical protein [Catenuloplanes nepalensis]
MAALSGNFGHKALGYKALGHKALGYKALGYKALGCIGGVRLSARRRRGFGVRRPCDSRTDSKGHLGTWIELTVFLLVGGVGPYRT